MLKKHKYNTLTGKEKHLAGWKTCVWECDRHHTSYSLTWDLNQWPPWSVTFPAHCASPFSSAPSWLTNSSRFIISAAGSCSETHRTWKLNISTWSCFTYIGAFISHRWSFYCSFSILLWVICSVEGHLFSCSEKGLCQASAGFLLNIFLLIFIFMQCYTNTYNCMYLICIQHDLQTHDPNELPWILHEASLRLVIGLNFLYVVQIRYCKFGITHTVRNLADT